MAKSNKKKIKKITKIKPAKARPVKKTKTATKTKVAPVPKQHKSKIKKMPSAELKKFKLLLLKEREKVGGELSHITENTLNKSSRDVSGDLSGYSYHMADMASDDYEREFSLTRATQEQTMLYFIDEAIKRISEGSYGECLQCGKQISKKRLKAMPATELCIECQKTNET